ncbi:MAG: hypothetical protein OEO23_06315 [Gemmatimonadota bacterium]|nr:hypothetical protein [Gemmatimonadota bacterium]
MSPRMAAYPHALGRIGYVVESQETVQRPSQARNDRICRPLAGHWTAGLL